MSLNWLHITFDGEYGVNKKILWLVLIAWCPKIFCLIIIKKVQYNLEQWDIVKSGKL